MPENRPKTILVINSELPYPDFFSETGQFRLHFMRIKHRDDVQRLRGQVFYDVVWIHRLPFDHRDREYIEFAVKSRIIRPQEG